MLNLLDGSILPDVQAISAYVQHPLFDQFYHYMEREYRALCKIEYSKDVWAPGWNIKLRKAGKGLCVIYPKKGYFTVLVVVGRKEKERVEALLPQLSEEMQEIYRSTGEGNGQRWLMIEIREDDCVYRDMLELIRIRRESR